MSRHRPYEPRPIGVEVHHHPHRIAGRDVESIREQWLVEDRWWTDRPLRRHYYELVLTGGHCTVVFQDLRNGRWYAQR